jgi:UDP-N-acetyl-D-glucosamine/UDP-N-acetyl-D-galactosamine dehydrogenase
MEIKKIAVAGMGYVGLPLAVHLNKHFEVVGFDINEEKITQLKRNVDTSGEVSGEDLVNCSIKFTTDPSLLKDCQMVIACVPTPIDKHQQPDLTPLKSVSEIIGKNLSEHAIVVYESTVYPGVTEEICAPILEKFSGYTCGQEFKIGYSPERMNPGDKEHSVDKIVKIVSGMDDDSLNVIDYVYRKVTTTHRASSIKVAESAKVIENIQRDLNIALMNELSIIFSKLDINTKEVLAAAGTKWNFHNYHPGLVGGHCIGVDPYYLTYKAREIGYHPEVILAGRRTNDNMHKFYAEKIVKKLQKIGGKKVLVLGLTFKPDVADYRNSRVRYLIKELKSYGLTVYIYDPYLSKDIIESFGGIYFDPSSDNTFNLTVISTRHKKLLEMISQKKFNSECVLDLQEL